MKEIQPYKIRNSYVRNSYVRNKFVIRWNNQVLIVK